MANVATKRGASPNRLVYVVVGDGTVGGPTLDNARLLADMVAGPLKDLWNTVIPGATQDLLRTALSDGITGKITTQLRASPVDTTGQSNQITADVDTDAVTVTKGEINLSQSDTTGQDYLLIIEHVHSLVK